MKSAKIRKKNLHIFVLLDFHFEEACLVMMYTPYLDLILNSIEVNHCIHANQFYHLNVKP